jgi:hypothetical protein
MVMLVVVAPSVHISYRNGAYKLSSLYPQATKLVPFRRHLHVVVRARTSFLPSFLTNRAAPPRRGGGRTEKSARALKSRARI